jgi:hypothetical protein
MTFLLEKMVMEGCCQQTDFLFFPEFSKSTWNLYTSCRLFWFCDNFCLTILSFIKHKLPQNKYLLDKGMFFLPILKNCIPAYLKLYLWANNILHCSIQLTMFLQDTSTNDICSTGLRGRIGNFKRI